MQQQIDAVDGAVKGLDAAFKAFDAWTKVQGNVQAAIAEALKPYLLAEDALTIAEVNAAIAEAVKDALTVEDVEKTIEAWMGANFAKLIEPYNTSIATDLQAEQNARKAADEKLQADLEKQFMMENGNSEAWPEYFEEYKKKLIKAERLRIVR